MRRRSLLTFALAGAAAGLPALSQAATQAPRTLSLLNLHTGEALKSTYWEAGSYVREALQALSHVLRDHRTGEAWPMAPGLFDLLAALRGRLETEATIEVISGYRSPATNAALHAQSGGVATRSLHMLGEAMDIRIAGVDLARLRDAAWSLQGGGVGYYPQSQFVHVDVGRVRRW